MLTVILSPLATSSGTDLFIPPKIFIPPESPHPITWQSNNIGTFFRVGNDITYRRYQQFFTPELFPELVEKVAWMLIGGYSLAYIANYASQFFTGALAIHLAYLGTIYTGYHATRALLYLIDGKTGHEQIYISNSEIRRLFYLELMYDSCGHQRLNILPYPQQAGLFKSNSISPAEKDGVSTWTHLHSILINHNIASVQLSWVGEGIITGLKVTIKRLSGKTESKVLPLLFNFIRFYTLENMLHKEETPLDKPGSYNSHPLNTLMDGKILFEVLPELVTGSVWGSLSLDHQIMTSGPEKYLYTTSISDHLGDSSNLQLVWQPLPYPHYHPRLVISETSSFALHTFSDSLATQGADSNLAEHLVRSVEWIVFSVVLELLKHKWDTDRLYPSDNPVTTATNAFQNNNPRMLGYTEPLSISSWQQVLVDLPAGDIQNSAISYLEGLSSNALLDFWRNRYQPVSSVTEISPLWPAIIRESSQTSVQQILEYMLWERPGQLVHLSPYLGEEIAEFLTWDPRTLPTKVEYLNQSLDRDDLLTLSRSLLGMLDRKSTREHSKALQLLAGYLYYLPDDIHIELLSEYTPIRLINSPFSLYSIRVAFEKQLQGNQRKIMESAHKIKEWVDKTRTGFVAKLFFDNSAVNPKDTSSADQMIWEAIKHFPEKEKEIIAKTLASPDVDRIDKMSRWASRTLFIDKMIYYLSLGTLSTTHLLVIQARRPDLYQELMSLTAGPCWAPEEWRYSQLASIFGEDEVTYFIDLIMEAARSRQLVVVDRLIDHHGYPMWLLIQSASVIDDIAILTSLADAKEDMYFDHLGTVQTEAPEEAKKLLDAVNADVQINQLRKRLEQTGEFSTFLLKNTHYLYVAKAIQVHLGGQREFNRWDLVGPETLVEILRLTIANKCEACLPPLTSQLLAMPKEFLHKLELKSPDVAWLSNAYLKLHASDQLPQRESVGVLAMIASREKFDLMNAMLQPMTDVSLSSALMSELTNVVTDPGQIDIMMREASINQAAHFLGSLSQSEQWETSLQWAYSASHRVCNNLDLLCNNPPSDEHLETIKRWTTINRLQTKKLALLDNIHHGLTCTICFKLFNKPMTTTCGHLFCHHCLTDMFQHQASNTILCPLCRDFVHKNQLRQPPKELESMLEEMKKATDLTQND
ncbi:MAG: RING finger domain-containing protein [Endozoicomonas sp.]